VAPRSLGAQRHPGPRGLTHIPHTHRYRPTPLGWRTAWFYHHAYNRFLRTGSAELADPSTTRPLCRALDELAEKSGLAA
jgi:hypothetical protein